MPCCLLRLSVLPGLPCVEGTAITPPLQSCLAVYHLFSLCCWCLYVKYEGTAFGHPPLPGKAMAAHHEPGFPSLKKCGAGCRAILHTAQPAPHYSRGQHQYLTLGCRALSGTVWHCSQACTDGGWSPWVGETNLNVTALLASVRSTAGLGMGSRHTPHPESDLLETLRVVEGLAIYMSIYSQCFSGTPQSRGLPRVVGRFWRGWA